MKYFTCIVLTTPSDRAIFMTNFVAEYVNENFASPKYVGIYAYNDYSPPPAKVRLNPHVIVSVATSFIRGGFTATELTDG